MTTLSVDKAASQQSTMATDFSLITLTESTDGQAIAALALPALISFEEHSETVQIIGTFLVCRAFLMYSEYPAKLTLP